MSKSNDFSGLRSNDFDVNAWISQTFSGLGEDADVGVSAEDTNWIGDSVTLIKLNVNC